VQSETALVTDLFLQFRAEATDALNHTNLDSLNTRPLDQNSFDKVESARDPRITQLGLRLTF
jgi:hypothetical protein